MGRDARRPRESLCWRCLINLASRASDFLLSNPVEFSNLRREEKKKFRSHVLEQGHSMEPLLLSGFLSAGGFCLHFLHEAGGSQGVAKTAREDTGHQSQVLAEICILTSTIS